ncbi:MAG: 4'-phosphopantetheinyl transferase superfamily protein [Pseudomonadota bacterium]
MSLDCSRLGLDAAMSREFPAGYPFARAFRGEEWRQITGSFGMEASRGAALLWSAKEAAAKMAGCGFHLFEPRDVSVTVLGKDEYAWRSEVSLPPTGETSPVRAYSFEQNWGWISLALQ